MGECCVWVCVEVGAWYTVCVVCVVIEGVCVCVVWLGFSWVCVVCEEKSWRGGSVKASTFKALLYKKGGGAVATLDDSGADILLITPSNGTKLLELGEELKGGVAAPEPRLEPNAELVGKELESAELGEKKEAPREELLDVCTKILRVLSW